MKVRVKGKTKEACRLLSGHGDVYDVLSEGVRNNRAGFMLRSVKVEACCGGRKYQFQNWFFASDVEIQPAQPAQPVQPVPPAPAAKPAQPVPPVQVAKPAQPVQPAQPVPTAKPAQPAQAGAAPASG
jgi:hypothetical protein